MKCPKCGYMSFDYNQVCPKCNKDISSEQAKLNMPSFRPDPPSLLGVLTGEVDESNVGFNVDAASSLDASHDMDVSMGDSVVLEEEEKAGLDEDQSLEISLETDDSGDFEIPAEGESDETEDVLDLGIDGGDEDLTLGEDAVSIEDTDEGLAAPAMEEEGEEDVSLDLGDISLEEPEQEISAAEEISEEESAPEISLDELSPDDAISEDQDTGLDDSSEIELGLDDLKINETGELEISQVESAVDAEAAQMAEDLALDDSAGEAEEESLDLGDLAIDDTESEAEEEALDLGEISLDDDAGDDEASKLIEDLALDDSGEEAQEESLDVDGIDLDDSTSEEGDEALDLGDLSLDESDSEDDEKTMVYDEPPSMDEAGLEDMVSDESVSEASDEDLDLDSITLDDEDQEGKDISADDMDLDLENLDIDLDLDDSEDK